MNIKGISNNYINMIGNVDHPITRPMDLGLALRKLRLNKGYSQQYVAHIFDISRNAYMDWESNKVKLTVQNCDAICRFYDIKLSQFFSTFLENQ